MEEAGEGGGTDVKKSPTVGETEAPPKDGLLRDNMVDLATRFLTNSRVQNSPMEQRRAFLKKKGMQSLSCLCNFILMKRVILLYRTH